MYVVCPKCRTCFKVPKEALGTEGRKLRCAKCGHIWFASIAHAAKPADIKRMREDQAKAAQNAAKQPVAPTAQPKPTPKKETKVEAPKPAPKPEKTATPKPEPKKEAPKPKEAPKAEEEAEGLSQDAVDSLFDTPAPKKKEEPKAEEADGLSQDAVDSLFDTPAPKKEAPKAEEEADGLSQDAVDSLFDTPAPKKEEAKADDEGLSQDAVDGLFDTPAPPPPEADNPLAPKSPAVDDTIEEMPEIFKGKDPFSIDNSKLRNLRSIIIVASLTLFLSVFYFARYPITRAMPFMKHVYKILHIRSVIPGEGLEFKNITRREVEQDYVRKLEIKGFVVNASEIQREIPMILVKLVDDNANVVQETKVFPPVDFVAPGMSTSFEVLVDSPSSSAKYVVTTFTERPDD